MIMALIDESNCDCQKKNEVSKKLAYQVFTIAHRCGGQHKPGAGLDIASNSVAQHVITNQSDQDREQARCC